MPLFSRTENKSRKDTLEHVRNVLGGANNAVHFGKGPIVISDIPSTAKKAPVIMGIDEAGRGPVLGPMTYSAAYWVKDTKIPDGYDDSKQLTAEQRQSLFQQTLDTAAIGFVLRVLHASEISRNMLRYPHPYNLNAMSHDAAMEMIQSVLDAGVAIDTCYVDTVGVPEAYKAKLDREFSGKCITFVVEKKADSRFIQCSAASVVAKVARDTILENWKWTEPDYATRGESMLDFGSGYPSDPKCKDWLKKNLKDSVFGFPDLVRFSWGPAKQAVEEGCIEVQWETDEDDDETKQRNQLKAFLNNEPTKKRRRLAYFEHCKAKRVTTLIAK